MLRLVRFWIEFNTAEEKNTSLHFGCGITAWTYDDAINILKTTLFKNHTIPTIIKVIEDFDLNNLEENHVCTNIVRPSSVRGIWYPPL